MHNLQDWDRAIILVDMNAFFASIEQRDFPELQGRPVGVTNGLKGTCIITCSYEARAYGVKTGMRLKQAHQLCPGFIQRPARPEVYARVSTAIMHCLYDFTPAVEVFSVDEAFLDITGCQRLMGDPVSIARRVQRRVNQVAGVPSSIGLSGDKTTAKYAAKQHKPNGFTVIPPWRAQQALHDVPVKELCGVSHGIGRYLADRGARTCGEVAQLPISELGRRFGHPGRRIWLMTQGKDPDGIHSDIAAPKSIGHGKVVPPGTTSRSLIKVYLSHMSTKVAERLRKNGLAAQRFWVGLRTGDGWINNTVRSVASTDSTRLIRKLVLETADDIWQGEQGLMQVQVTALDPRPNQQQADLFERPDPRGVTRDQTMDKINQRFGQFALTSASLLNRSTMPDVIAPAWKPYGHRQTIFINKDKQEKGD